MFQIILSRLIWFFVLVVLQVIVLNHVHIFGYATPLPYIYLLLILPGETPRWAYVAIGFFLGLIIDMFTNTPGVAAGATCLTGLMVPLLLKVSTPNETSDENFFPSYKSMEWTSFIRYAVLATLVQTTAFFSLESFSFLEWQSLLINVIGSTILTTLFIAALELIRNK